MLLILVVVIMLVAVGYTMDTMYFSWLPDDPVDIKGIEMPQFTLQKWELRDCSQSYTAGTASAPDSDVETHEHYN